MNLANILTVTAAVVMVIAAFGNTWAANRSSRRAASGTVATSQAQDLWEANKNLIDRLLAENDKLIDQRDKLVSSFEQMVPVMQQVVGTQKRDGELLARMLTLLEGGAHAHEGLPPALEDG